MSLLSNRPTYAIFPILTGLVASLWTSSLAGEVDDSASQTWHYSDGNQQMKAGHRQIRKWRASNDSARQLAMEQVYGSSGTSVATGFAGRSSAASVLAAPTPLGTEHSFANGRIKGKWVLNRISNTTAKGGYGSGVRLDRTAYDTATNTLYALTTEGNLVSAPLVQMGAWEVKNQVVQIARPSFTGVSLPGGGYRLVGMIKGLFRYSDDAGLTWTESVGGASSSSTSVWTATMGNGDIVSLVTRTGLDVLIRSTDQGASFKDVQTWTRTSASAVMATWLYNTNDVCILLRKRETGSAVDVYRYADGSLAIEGSIPTAAKPTSMTGTVVGSTTRVYARMDDTTGWTTKDAKSWTNIKGWKEEVQTVLPDQPEVVISNAPEHDLSKDGGATWTDYPDNDNTIGWDPKHVRFYKVNGKWTLVAANDMGLCFNDDALNGSTWHYVNRNHSYAILHGGLSVDNVALTLTSNQDPGTFELTRTARDTFLATNRNGADGLRAAASNAGKAYWYRHYWASFMHAHAASTANTKKASIDIANDWYTPPFKGSTKSGEDAIYVSGWDKLIKLTYIAASNTITRTDLPKNFKVDAGDVTFGVGVAQSDPNRIYVTTKNGHFYTSKDAGQTWTETSYTGTKPVKQWADWSNAAGLYIEVADSLPDLVFWGGGSGAAACLVSRDGGKTFASTVTGLPSGGEVRNVSIAPDGKLAFSSNFQVWLASDNKWYDLRSASLPSAALPAASALNYLPLQRKVRYFTWGAGVVDLDITSLNTTDNPEIAFNANSCYQVKSVSSGKSLTATATGSVVQAPYTGAASQTWRLVGVDAFFRLENTGTGKVLEVAANSFKEGALVQTAAWSGSDNQQWNIVRNGSSYAFAARHSVKTLEIAAASIADSAKADQGIYSGAAHQNWNVVEAVACGASPVRQVSASDRLRLSSLGKGRYRIEGTEGAIVHVLAWDRTGRIVRRETTASEIDLSALAKGVYHIRVWGGHIDATIGVSIVP
ncbi:MAG: hypothetical protein RL173_2000 [Fibrobacterota bacterium]|jgi:hypothetical protein